MIYFHTRRYFSLSLFEESSKETGGIESSPSKRGRGRPPKLKAVCTPSLEETHLIKEDEIHPEITTENNHQPVKEVEIVVTLNHIEDSSDETLESEVNWEIEQNNDFAVNDVSQEFQENENYSDDFCEEDLQNSSEIRDFSQNNISVSFSWSLMNQLRQMSKMEGISVEDLLVELVAEGVAKRVFEDQMRPTPSHLMTRTGYVHSDGTQAAPQPHLSHHSMNNRQQQNNLQNRNRFGFQPRNPQQQNNNRSQLNNRNYQQQNNNSRQQNSNQNNFRNQYQNNNAQNQRFNTRANYQNSQRFYEDQNSSNQQNNNQYRQQRDNNKR